MRYLPFKLALFFGSLMLGLLAVALFFAGQMTETDEVSTVAPAILNTPAKPKKIVCSLGENRNDGMSCECKEVDE